MKMIPVVYGLFAFTILFLSYLVAKLLGILVTALLLYMCPILFVLLLLGCAAYYAQSDFTGQGFRF
jgi:flagellar biosynthesis protein FlhB